MKHILDNDFNYTPSAKTDMRRLFARIKKEQAAKAVAEAAASKPALLLQYRRGAK